MFLFDDVDVVRTAQDMPMRELWTFLPFGYIFTISIETVVLLVGMPREVTYRQRLACGVWLTACTYPIVVLVLPALFYGSPRYLYLLVAETFAPLAECLLFWLVFRNRSEWTTAVWTRAFAAIIAANLASFGIGEILNAYQWFGLFQ